MQNNKDVMMMTLMTLLLTVSEEIEISLIQSETHHQELGGASLKLNE